MLKAATKITVGVDQVLSVTQACAGKNFVHEITFDPRIPAPLMIVSILITFCLPVNQASHLRVILDLLAQPIYQPVLLGLSSHSRFPLPESVILSRHSCPVNLLCLMIAVA